MAFGCLVRADLEYCSSHGVCENRKTADVGACTRRCCCGQAVVEYGWMGW